MSFIFGEGVNRDGFATVLPAKAWQIKGAGKLCRATACAPGKPGVFTSANLANVRGFLDGVEVPIAVEAMRGTHPDGSYRSVGIQFRTVSWWFRRAFRVEVWDTPRSVENTLTWIEPTWEVPGGENATDWPAIENMAVFALTDAQYLCDSFVTLCPLTPVTGDTASVAAWTAEMESQWTSAVANGTSSGTAIYDHAHGCYTYYCRTGNLDWYEWGHQWAVKIDGPIPGTSSASHSISATLTPQLNAACTNNETFNPELVAGSLNASNCIGPSEAYSLRIWSAVSGYWFSSWRQPMRYISFTANRATWPVTSRASAGTELISHGWRFNFGREIMSILAGYLTECTTELGSSGGNPAGNLDDYPTMLDWVIGAMEDRAWDATDAATCPWLEGIVGIVPGAQNDCLTTGVENFQASIPAEFLMAYYDLVEPDTRIPPMLLTLGEYLELQTRPSIVGEAGYPDSYITPYCDKDPVDIASGAVGGSGYTLPMHAPLFAWLWAYTGQTKWRDLCDNAIKPANITGLGMQTKIWGELWGGMRQQVGYYRAGNAIRALPAATSTAAVQPTTHATLG